jgi:hypothetical protein
MGAHALSTPMPPSMVHGYVWLSPNFGDMWDSGNLGEQSMPLSVPPVAASGGDDSSSLSP